MPKDLLEIRDTLDEARILLHAIFMAADALGPKDGNAIATVADLAATRLDEVKQWLAQAHEAAPAEEATHG